MTYKQKVGEILAMVACFAGLMAAFIFQAYSVIPWPILAWVAVLSGCWLVGVSGLAGLLAVLCFIHLPEINLGPYSEE